MVRERQLEQRRGRSKWIAFAIGLARGWRDYRQLTVRMTVDGTALGRARVLDSVLTGLRGVGTHLAESANENEWCESSQPWSA